MKKNIVLFLTLSLCFILTACSKNKKTGCNSSGINIDEFNQIELGDDRITVEGIIDPDDTWIEDGIYDKCVQEVSQKTENHKYYYTYKYLGENEGYAIITYLVDYSDGQLFSLPTVSSKKAFNIK